MGSVTYGYSGSWVKFTVPDGVHLLQLQMNGAGSNTRKGGRITGNMSVNPGDVFYFSVGGAGKAPVGSTGGAAVWGGSGKGGNGRNGKPGGWSGGGATVCRAGSTSGTVKAVAAGAGGDSGDNGAGGHGGAAVGAVGGAGTDGTGSTGPATGGTQTQGGEGGASAAGAGFAGAGASDAVCGTAGAGGTPPSGSTGSGGGGGGGGYHGGGGGCASAFGVTPGGGGAGGANFVSGLSSAVSTQGYATGNGAIKIVWSEPTPGNRNPTAPTITKIGTYAPADGLATKQYGSSLTVKAIVHDPDVGDTIQAIVQYSPTSSFTTYKTAYGTYVANGAESSATLTGLVQDTRYYLRVFCRDKAGHTSLTWSSTNFWMNRRPDPPTLVQPADNADISVLSAITFQWTHVDPDPSDPQRYAQLRWRPVGTLDWTTVTINSSANNYITGAGTFKSSVTYEWQVHTRDASLYSQWSEIRSFNSTGATIPPLPTYPISSSAVNTLEPVVFTWNFRTAGQTQTKADLRYRVKGQADNQWITLFGDTTTPGANWYWSIPENTFGNGFEYEWQVRTYDTGTAGVTDWSISAYFHSVSIPLSVSTTISPNAPVLGALGCGVHRAYIYNREGTYRYGELTPPSSIEWVRVRDDLGSANVTIEAWDKKCGALMAELRTWHFSLVIYRDDDRVFEGPITRLAYRADKVEIEARDVMAWVYRKIMKQGYNDAYRVVNGVPQGLSTVVRRGRQIIMDALSRDDPNVLQYLVTFDYPDDARQSRVRPDYSSTAWEELDSLAATAGLDYTTAGRRIILWDTHRPIGRLPELRDGDFSDPPIVTEYGMSLATDYAVTDNNGIWGEASRGDHSYYGRVELLASSYSDAQTITGETTLAAAQKMREAFKEQADRAIAPRYPAPVVVRVPDNTTLSPNVALGIQQLIPGVWAPLRSTSTLREVEQWQKLDRVVVTETPEGGEKIQVTFSPAPNGGADPDADQAAEEA